VPVAVALHDAFNFVQQSAGMANVFDKTLFLSRGAVTAELD
jgi:hypothetical protein